MRLGSMFMVMNDFRNSDPDIQQSKSRHHPARDAGAHQTTDRRKGQQVMILVPISRPRKEKDEQPDVETKHNQNDDG